MSTTLASPHPSTTFVKQSRFIRATRQAVYDAWTKPEIFSSWWGPADQVVSEVVIDAREGGVLFFRDDALLHAYVPPGFPRTMTGQGLYTDVVPGERLQFTMKASWNPDGESLVTVTFRDADGGTKMDILHEQLPANTAHLFDSGWTSTINKLAALIEA